MMLRTRVIPTLLLKQGGLVKTVKFKNPTYIGDPINAVKIFNEKEVDELILLDITATKEKREPNFIQIEAIVSEAFMPIGYGGGINSLSQIEKLFKLGIEKVVINTSLFNNPDMVTEASSIFGAQSIVASIDIKTNILGKYQLYSHSGSKKQKVNIVNFVSSLWNMGIGEIIINSIDRDGTMHGYDIDLLKIVSQNSNVPVVALGGAGKLEHLSDAVNIGGASAVAAGSMFVFQGVHRAVLISYPEYNKLEMLLN